MKKYISFSLYGDNPKYLQGAIRNVSGARVFYPGWTPVFWVAPEIPQHIRDTLLGMGAELRTPENPPANKMFWRFLINDEPGYERYMIRDADSRPSAREQAAVKEWEASGRRFHAMRDHPAHARPINGGLWGCVAGLIPSMRQLIDEWDPEDEYGEDQDFLGKVIWPMVESEALQHDSVCRESYGARRFPTKRLGSPRFVGEVFEIDERGCDVPRSGDHQQIDCWKD